MTAKSVSSFLVSGCLVALLAVTPEVGVASGQIKPQSDQGDVSFWDLAPIPAAPAKTPPRTTTWFRNTFVVFRADATRPPGPTDGAMSARQTAKVQPAPPEVAVPGTVQNLRRADRP